MPLRQPWSCLTLANNSLLVLREHPRDFVMIDLPCVLESCEPFLPTSKYIFGHKFKIYLCIPEWWLCNGCGSETSGTLPWSRTLQRWNTSVDAWRSSNETLAVFPWYAALMRGVYLNLVVARLGLISGWSSRYFTTLHKSCVTALFSPVYPCCRARDGCYQNSA